MNYTDPLMLLSGAVATLSGAVVFLFQTAKKDREKLDETFRIEREKMLSSFLDERNELRLSQELQSSQLLIISKEIYQKLGEMTTLLTAVFERRTKDRS